MNKKVNLKKMEAKQRALQVSEMLNEMIDAGIAYEEIGAEVRCSRMTLVNWMNKAHPPRAANFKAVERAYNKFRDRRRRAVAPPPLMVETLIKHGFTRERLSEKLAVAETTVEGWMTENRKPLGGNLRRLQDLYSKVKEIEAA